MANKERLLQLADVVEKGHHKFNGIDAALVMSDWMVPATSRNKFRELARADEDYEFNGIVLPARVDLPEHAVDNCNTAACMAGFACLIFDYERSSKMAVGQLAYDVRHEAQRLLDLTGYQADELFQNQTSRGITGPDAAKVIRHFVKTGSVNWYIMES